MPCLPNTLRWNDTMYSMLEFPELENHANETLSMVSNWHSNFIDEDTSFSCIHREKRSFGSVFHASITCLLNRKNGSPSNDRSIFHKSSFRKHTEFLLLELKLHCLCFNYGHQYLMFLLIISIWTYVCSHHWILQVHRKPKIVA